jgi:dTDP-4-dehydrorhamnose 3,5-epimerase
MEIIEKYFDEILVMRPNIYNDTRGSLHETYNDSLLGLIPRMEEKFCLEYISKSYKDVIRGMHYQIGVPQGKIVSAIYGKIFDVVVDMRENSNSFGQHRTIELNDQNKNMIWIPPGFAHGFQCLSDSCVLLYKCTGPYSPMHEQCIIWDDDQLSISWSNKIAPIISDKDRLGVNFECANYFMKKDL